MSWKWVVSWRFKPSIRQAICSSIVLGNIFLQNFHNFFILLKWIEDSLQRAYKHFNQTSSKSMRYEVY